MNNFPIQKGLSTTLQIRAHNGRKTLFRTDGKGTLPGQARIRLEDPGSGAYVRKSHLVGELDALVPYLKFTTTPPISDIHPLHEEATRGRTVILTEDPGLHLVWYYDKMLIKPIPPYLLEAAFWEYIQEADLQVYKAVAGFMKTYYHLIQYESDFRSATRSDVVLISREPGDHPITYEEFVEFIAQFQQPDDKDVSPRFSYGVLRLGTLNHLTRLSMHGMSYRYFHLHPRWGDYLRSLVTPLITLFAIVSTVLSCMQVVLTAQGLDGVESWSSFIVSSIRFSLATIVLVEMVALGIVLLVILRAVATWTSLL
ncbi:hypothetical protein GLAREA_09152 [Glarea lozoyensis ATCC 20868]|uniref:Uncharacterized protein n=1 Tax=Glarea lozoyensis (strain ATCC 20868 / MF5171) TaxID=1116229 RepID=S3DIK0_GLAL2|nr:uncharacterized protein GLAREA_09152 [Glarea lozoyensis ATCC 20868]EPE36989.1 hypothetical protein GLAREA_09152 [Glarea lozoyensis ATCC 20868]